MKSEDILNDEVKVIRLRDAKLAGHIFDVNAYDMPTFSN